LIKEYNITLGIKITGTAKTLFLSNGF